MVVLSQLKQYSSEEEPQSNGAKFYHIIDNSAYRTARIFEIEKGTAKEIATHPLEADPSRDAYMTLSFFPERDGRAWWAWCERGPAKQIPFLQGELDHDWRLANASRDRRAQLAGDQFLIDTIVFSRKREHLEMADYEQVWSCSSVQELEAATVEIPGCRIIALTFDRKAQQVAAGQPATTPRVGD
ncbi:MAG: hypothetical protein R3F11_01780 [Verrucomicrobiales bacterium]